MTSNSDAETVRVATVIVNYRTPDHTVSTLEALAGERERLPHLRALVVDGDSRDGSAERLDRALGTAPFASWVRFMPLGENGGFGWANNQAILALLASTDPPEFIHLLNPDAEVEPGALATLVETMQRDPRVAAAGSQLLNTDGTPTGSAFSFPSPAREFLRGARTGAFSRLLRIESDREAVPAGDVDWVTGASVLLRVEALREVGLFDTGFFLYFEETELMWRLRRAGWRIRHEPASRVRHIGGAATGMTYSRRDLSRRPPLPLYWFASRRRLLALTQGRAGAAATSLAWLAGHLVLTARALLGLRGKHVPIAHEGRDLWRYGIRADRNDRTSHAVPANDTPGAPPAWRLWRPDGWGNSAD